MMVTKISPIQLIGSVWRRIRYIWVGMTWGQNFVMPQFGGGGVERSKRKICPFFSLLIENQKLYNISKNQAPKSIRKGDMKFPLLFDLKKVLFLPYLPSKLGWKVEIWYVHLVGAIDALFGDIDFSASFQPFSAPKKYFLVKIFIPIICWVCSSHNSPPNWARKLKTGMYIE